MTENNTAPPVLHDTNTCPDEDCCACIQGCMGCHQRYVRTIDGYCARCVEAEAWRSERPAEAAAAPLSWEAIYDAISDRVSPDVLDWHPQAVSPIGDAANAVTELLRAAGVSVVGAPDD